MPNHMGLSSHDGIRQQGATTQADRVELGAAAL